MDKVLQHLTAPGAQTVEDSLTEFVCKFLKTCSMQNIHIECVVSLRYLLPVIAETDEFGFAQPPLRDKADICTSGNTSDYAV